MISRVYKILIIKIPLSLMLTKKKTNSCLVRKVKDIYVCLCKQISVGKSLICALLYLGIIFVVIVFTS